MDSALGELVTLDTWRHWPMDNEKDTCQVYRAASEMPGDALDAKASTSLQPALSRVMASFTCPI